MWTAETDHRKKLRFSWRGLMVRNRSFVKYLNLTVDARDGFARQAILFFKYLDTGLAQIFEVNEKFGRKW